MTSIVNFLFESGISLALLSVLYLIVLRKETFFRSNRIFLLVSLLFSLVLPLLHIPVFTPQSNMLGEVRVTPYQNMLDTIIVNSRDVSATVETAVISSALIVWTYFTGLVVFLFLFLFRIIQLKQLVRKGDIVKHKGFSLITLPETISPFAFMNYIFVGQNFRETEGYERMLLHEMEHVKQGHTFDVLILEILTVFQWFNPFMWILRRAVRENHEYLADKAVLSGGVAAVEYKILLLNQYVGGPVMATSHFSKSLVLSRIKMMGRLRSSKIAMVKFLLGIVLASALVVVFACEHKNTGFVTLPQQDETLVAILHSDTLVISGDSGKLQQVVELINSGRYRGTYIPEEGRAVISTNPEVEQSAVEKKMEMLLVAGRKNQSAASTVKSSEIVKNTPSGDEDIESDQVFFIVEDMPEFPGGEAALRQFIATTVKYPVSAQENGIQGRVYITFVVSKDGSVKDAKVVRGVDPALDNEALRVVRSLPKWKPGVQRGKPVNVSYTVPINFVIN